MLVLALPGPLQPLGEAGAQRRPSSLDRIGVAVRRAGLADIRTQIVQLGQGSLALAVSRGASRRAACVELAPRLAQTARVEPPGRQGVPHSTLARPVLPAV